MQPVQPLHTAELFAPLHRALMALLGDLADDDWLRPTAAGRWRVRDVAAHLLDGDVRQISFRRDHLAPLPPPFPINGYADLVRFLDGVNAVWVEAFERVSPRVMVALHAMTGPVVAELFEKLDPHAPALFGVAWAGEAASPNWFDTAREYTERWHHQQQIREAVGAVPLTERRWLHPVLDTFLRALPHAYRSVEADADTCLVFEVTGEAGGTWTLRRDGGAWVLYAGAPDEAAGRVTADADTTWRHLTKGLSREAARGRVRVAGPETLAAPFLEMRAIMG